MILTYLNVVVQLDVYVRIDVVRLDAMQIKGELALEVVHLC
jgi:hypothetical protein